MNAPSHLDLIGTARAARRAAARRDAARLREELARLRTSVRAHFEAERAALSHLSEPAARVIRRRQRRLLDLLDRAATTDSTVEDCDCLVRAVQVERALLQQARVESSVLPHHPDRPPGRD